MREKNIALFTAVIFLLILAGLSCNNDNPTDGEGNLIVCFDVHSQPPYPEQGDNVDLSSVIRSMDDNTVSRSILSARVEMRYSEDIAEFAENNPDRILAAVSLKLACMNSDTGFTNNLTRQVETGRYQAVAEMLLYHAEKFENGASVAPEFLVLPSDPKVRR